MKTKKQLQLKYPHESGTMFVVVDYEHEVHESSECEFNEFGQSESFSIQSAVYDDGEPVDLKVFNNEDVINDIYTLIELKGHTMNTTEYVANALKTESIDMKPIIERLSDPTTVRLLHAAMGLETETGEIQDQLKKHIFYGKKLDLAVSSNVTHFSAGRVVDQHLDWMSQLQGLGKQTRELLDLINQVTHADDQAYYEAKSKLSRLTGHKGSATTLLVGLQAELRKQLEFYFNVQEKLFNLKQVKEFQKIVLETIREQDPETARKIAKRLVEVQAAYSSIDLFDQGD